MDNARKVARGAGLVFLGRSGALVEIITVFVFTRLYGADAFGVFTLLWGYILVLAVICDAGMTFALQRFIPGEEDEQRVHRIARHAFLMPIGLGIGAALLLTLSASWLAPLIHSAKPVGEIAAAIRIYAWALPVWCMVEAVTAAVRARHAFGPEITIRIFYEQSLRLVFGVAFYFLGSDMLGLFASHLIALVVVAILAVRLLGRYYDLRLLLKPGPATGEPLPNLVHYGSSMVIPNISTKLHSNLPLIVLNAMIPGAAGAVAVTVYAVARKIVSSLGVIRESFAYVVAPVTAADERRGNTSELERLYRFSTLLMSSLFLPACTLVVLFRLDLLKAAGSDFTGATLAAGSATLIILAIGRLLEVLAGPSVEVLAMVGRYHLPMLNAVIGILATTALLFILVPYYGIAGGAVAAIIGLNVTNYLSALQLWQHRRVRPYSVRSLMLLLPSVTCSCLIYLIERIALPYGLVPRLAAGLIAGGACFFLLVRLAYAGYEDKSVDKVRKSL